MNEHYIIRRAYYRLSMEIAEKEQEYEDACATIRRLKRALDAAEDIAHRAHRELQALKDKFDEEFGGGLL